MIDAVNGNILGHSGVALESLRRDDNGHSAGAVLVTVVYRFDVGRAVAGTRRQLPAEPDLYAAGGDRDDAAATAERAWDSEGSGESDGGGAIGRFAGRLRTCASRKDFVQ